MSEEDQASFDAWEACLDEGLAAAVGPDRLAEIGYSDWTDFDSPSVEEWMLATFPPGDEVMAFIDVMFQCSEPRQWDQLILNVLGLEPDTDASRCVADAVIADPEARLLFLFGTTTDVVANSPGAQELEWVARVDTYIADCGAE